MIESEQVRTRFEAARAKRQPVESELESAYKYTSPQGWAPYASAPDRSEQYDSTAEDSANLLTNTILTYLLPQDQRWVSFGVSERMRAILSGATSQIDTLLEAEQAKFYESLNGSNFYLASSEALKDCVISGVGGVGVQVGDDGLWFMSLPPYQLYYLDDGGCYVDTVFRCHDLPVRTIVSRYKTVPDWVSKLAEDRPDECVSVVEAMTPEKGDKYEYSVWLEKGWERLDSKVSDYPCFIVFRWDKSSGAVWGDSPVRKALPSIRVLNRIVCDLLDDSAYAARGLWTASDDSLKDAKPEPGSIIITNDPEGLKPVPFPGSLQVSVQMVESYRNEIRSSLMADVLPQSDRMTTAEVQVRQQQFFRRIGVYALRLEEEFLERIVESTVRALMQAGVMKPWHGVDVVIETRSLVRRVQAQKQVEEVLMLLQAVSALGPAGTTHIDMTATGRFILEKGGFPAHLLKDSEQVAREIQAQQMAQAAGGAMQIARGQGNPETMKATGEAAAAVMPQMTQMMAPKAA